MQRAERKFENKVLEKVALNISIYQIELSNIVPFLETYVSNFISLFVKLSDTSIFTKEIKDKLSKIDEDIKASGHHLSLDLSYSSEHFTKIRYLENFAIIIIERRSQN